jgi:hypothetical protein
MYNNRIKKCLSGVYIARCAFATLCHQRYMDYGGGADGDGSGGGREKRKTRVLLVHSASARKMLL